METQDLRDLMEHKTGTLNPEIGKKIVEGIKELQEEFDNDINEYFNENKAIEFYLDKLYNYNNVYMVISDPNHPNEEKSIELLFKLIDIIKENNIYSFERSYNKLKVWMK